MNIATATLNAALQTKRQLTPAEDALLNDAAMLAFQGLVISKQLDYAEPAKDMLRCWKVAESFVRAKSEV
jgi:hypothetical protein